MLVATFCCLAGSAIAQGNFSPNTWNTGAQINPPSILPPAVEEAYLKGYLLIEYSAETTGGPVERSQCGGYLVNAEERLVITAWHCLPSYKALLNISLSSGGYRLEFVDGIQEAELALLRIAKVPEGKSTIPFISDVRDGMPVYGRSFQTAQFGADPTNTNKTLAIALFFRGSVPFTGVITATGETTIGRPGEGKDKSVSLDMVETGHQLLRIEGQNSEPGFSGSPVYAESGEVVGIVSSGGKGEPTIVSSAKNFPALLSKYYENKKQ